MMHLNGNWAAALTAMAAARQWLRPEIVVPALSALAGVALAGGALLGEFRDVQRDQGRLAEAVGKVLEKFAELERNHNALAAEYGRAIARRDERVKNDDAAAAKIEKRLDRIEERLLVAPPNSQPRRER